MRTLALVAALASLSAAACGGHAATPAERLQACVHDAAPDGSIDRTLVTEEEGVTTVNYFHGGDETVLTIFPTARAAIRAAEAEARIGDAHDKRIRNVLYGGGGAVEDAIVRCARDRP